MDAMPDSDLQTREALLAKAVHAWVDDSELDSAVLGPAESGCDPGDSILSYLRAYYHRVVTEDLPAPSRLAAVAEAHARLGLHRPWSRSVSRGTRTWTRSPRRAWWWTSSPTTCPTWSTRSRPG